jgi:carbamoyltransferase
VNRPPRLLDVTHLICFAPPIFIAVFMVSGRGSSMRILAFQSGPHDAAAAVFEDYRLVAAVQEERLRRQKGWGDAVPWLAVDEVLRIAGWSRWDIDAIATIRGCFPLQYFHLSPLRDCSYALKRYFGRERISRDLSLFCTRFGTSDTYSLFRTDRFLAENAFRPDTKLFFANHHAAHAYAALFHTDWDDALVYTADGVGDNISYSIRTLRNGRLDLAFGDDALVARKRPTHDGLATAYGFATEACGFRMWRHEGKLTGLSARGEPTLADAFARHFRLDADGLIVSDFTGNADMHDGVLAICQGHSRENIAASIQKVAEDMILQSVRHWLALTGARRLALAGGLFANVRINRRLAEELPLDEIFIFPAMGDDGLAVGAGLSLLLERDGVPVWLAQRHRLDDVYLGRDYDDAIDRCLGGASKIRRIAGDPAKVATDLICAGKAGAIYAGRMEFGPRALGARSILASPADAGINDSLNERLNRSEFMPFAPVVLEEDADRVFDITPVNRYAARFMTITCAVKPEWRSRIPAVVHVDGTARPQIVSDRDNPLYADILRRFRSATGLPVLVNTSFNVHEEPIVNRPEECLQALTDGRVDFVVTRNAVYQTVSASPIAEEVSVAPRMTEAMTLPTKLPP